MKKLFILTAAGALLTVPAIAVQKCVALDRNVHNKRHQCLD